jgi:hypothetical protein
MRSNTEGCFKSLEQTTVRIDATRGNGNLRRFRNLNARKSFYGSQLMSVTPSGPEEFDNFTTRSEFEAVVVHHLEDANIGIVDILDGEANSNVLKAIRDLRSQIAELYRLVDSRLPPLVSTMPLEGAPKP